MIGHVFHYFKHRGAVDRPMHEREVTMYRVRINYRRILQNHIFTDTEQKYMMLLPFKRGMFAVS